MKIEDKRREPRTFIKIKVDYSCKDAYLYDYSANLSEGGIFIQTTKLHRVGDKIDVTFILPELLEKIEAKATVAWINDKKHPKLPMGMGLKFVRLPKKKKELIQSVIHKIEEGKRQTPI